jgi:hydroxymethylglutaryl-CoA lyase
MDQMKLPKHVTLTEVGPRDGLQNEKGKVPTADKIALVEALADAGFTRIETSSFVSPKWVPQMGDAAEIFQKLKKKSGIKYIALVPNEKGMDAALQSDVKDIAVFTAASETFNQKNINRGIEESLQDIHELLRRAKEKNIWVRGYISTGFGCPYEGKIDPQEVLKIALRLIEEDVDELSIGDTIGVATPHQVQELVALLLKDIPQEKIALHFHDTRGTALANVLAGMQMGITKFDSSAGGLGGCPYAPGASGNLATEDLLYMLEGMGITTGVNLEKVIAASQKIGRVLNRALPSKYLQAHMAKGRPT